MSPTRETALMLWAFSSATWISSLESWIILDINWALITNKKNEKCLQTRNRPSLPTLSNSAGNQKQKGSSCPVLSQYQNVSLCTLMSILLHLFSHYLSNWASASATGDLLKVPFQHLMWSTIGLKSKKMLCVFFCSVFLINPNCNAMTNWTQLFPILCLQMSDMV